MSELMDILEKAEKMIINDISDMRSEIAKRYEKIDRDVPESEKHGNLLVNLTMMTYPIELRLRAMSVRIWDSIWAECEILSKRQDSIGKMKDSK